MGKIILASGSPRRKKLLKQINFSFDVQESSVTESFDPALPAEVIVQKLAMRKCRDVAQQFSDALVIGADTIVVFQDKIMEKPAGRDDARNMLNSLSGETHQVFTGIALCKVDKQKNITDSLTFAEKTDVTFGNLNSKDIDAYVAGGSPMDKAGAYGIQDDFGAIFVKRINGDFYNVVGFPLHAFYNTMNNFAPEYLPEVNTT